MTKPCRLKPVRPRDQAVSFSLLKSTCPSITPLAAKALEPFLIERVALPGEIGRLEAEAVCIDAEMRQSAGEAACIVGLEIFITERQRLKISLGEPAIPARLVAFDLGQRAGDAAGVIARRGDDGAIGSPGAALLRAPEGDGLAQAILPVNAQDFEIGQELQEIGLALIAQGFELEEMRLQPEGAIGASAMALQRRQIVGEGLRPPTFGEIGAMHRMEIFAREPGKTGGRQPATKPGAARTRRRGDQIAQERRRRAERQIMRRPVAFGREIGGFRGCAGGHLSILERR